MTQVLILFLIITVPLGFAYYLDYKKDKKYFIESIKNLRGLLKYGVIIIVTIISYKILIPINIENDTELLRINKIRCFELYHISTSSRSGISPINRRLLIRSYFGFRILR